MIFIFVNIVCNSNKNHFIKNIFFFLNYKGIMLEFYQTSTLLTMTSWWVQLVEQHKYNIKSPDISRCSCFLVFFYCMIKYLFAVSLHSIWLKSVLSLCSPLLLVACKAVCHARKFRCLRFYYYYWVDTSAGLPFSPVQ